MEAVFALGLGGPSRYLPVMVRIAIIGVSGFSGMELLRLASACTDVEITGLFSDRFAGKTLHDQVAIQGKARDLVIRPMSELATFGEMDIAVLATPFEASLELTPSLLDRGFRVLDLSGAYRIQDLALFAQYYKVSHPQASLVAEAHYSLPQLPRANPRGSNLRTARLVANPGCYATATILALAPLLQSKVIEPEGIFVDGKSGVTGAGRKVAEKYLFTEVAENVSPYRVLDHQHTPEMEEALSRVSDTKVSLSFVPHLLPVRRGLMVAAFARLQPGISSAQASEAMQSFTSSAPSPLGRLLDYASPEEVTIHSVANTIRARLGVRVDEQRRTVVSLCAIDNLLKGAASQALENVLQMAGTEVSTAS